MCVGAYFKIMALLIYMIHYKTRLKHTGPKNNQAFPEKFSEISMFSPNLLFI